MSDAYRGRDTHAQPWDVPPDDADRRPPPGGAPARGDGGDRPVRAVSPLPVAGADDSAPPSRSAAAGAGPADDRGGPEPGAERDRARATGADGPAPTERGDRGGRTEVEQAVPFAEQLRTRVADVCSMVGSSIPIRTTLFVLPPFVLPPLAFDLTVGETIVAALLLLWLAGAAAVLASIIVDGTDQVALRAIDRRLERLTERREDEAGEALLAIGGQLDVLTDRIEGLAASVAPRPPATRAAPLRSQQPSSRSQQPSSRSQQPSSRSQQPSSRPWRPAEGADPRADDPRW